MRFECTISEAATMVEIVVHKNRPAMLPDTLKMEARLFARRYRTRIPNFIKELLLKKQFSFDPNFIMANAYTAGGEYRLRYEFSYPEIRGLIFQTFFEKGDQMEDIGNHHQRGIQSSDKKGHIEHKN